MCGLLCFGDSHWMFRNLTLIHHPFIPPPNAAWRVKMDTWKIRCKKAKSAKKTNKGRVLNIMQFCGPTLRKKNKKSNFLIFKNMFIPKDAFFGPKEIKMKLKLEFYKKLCLREKTGPKNGMFRSWGNPKKISYHFFFPLWFLPPCFPPSFCLDCCNSPCNVVGMLSNCKMMHVSILFAGGL